MRNLTLGILLCSILIGMAGATLTVSHPIIAIGSTQTLTAQASGGVPPYTFNFLVYNPANVLSFNSLQTVDKQQPDVIVQYSNGLLVGYNASTNTDNARGIALMEAAGNAVSGSSIYLKAETYNLEANYINMSSGGFSLYGAGAYATKIYSTKTAVAIVVAGSNTVISSLGIYAINKGQFQYPYGMPHRAAAQGHWPRTVRDARMDPGSLFGRNQI